MIISHSIFHSLPYHHNIMIISILNINFILNYLIHNILNLYNHTINDFYNIFLFQANLLLHSLYPNTNNT